MKFKHLIFILFLIPFSTFSQSLDLVLGASTSHFLGDLGGKQFQGTNDFQDIDLRATRLGATAGLRFNINKVFALKGSFWYGRLYGDDNYTQNKERKGRNLNFFTNIYEGNLVAEITFGTRKRKSGYFYAFGGVGYFFFNPQTKLNGETYNLVDYGTEGQYLTGKTPYALSSICFPNGIGYKWGVSRNSYLSFEVNMRKTKTDYIDDVSTNYVDPAQLTAAKGPVAAQLADRNNSDIPGFSDPGAIRGDPKNNDSYFFFCFSYNLVLNQGKGGSAFSSGGKKYKSRKPKKGKCFEF